MRISSIRFLNYRCFGDLSISFGNRLTVIVAGNGYGKTAILDGLSYLLGVFVKRFKGQKASTVRDLDFREVWERCANAQRDFKSSKAGPCMQLQGLFETVKDYSQAGFALPKFPCEILRLRDKAASTDKSVHHTSYGYRNMWQFADVFVSPSAERPLPEFPIIAYYGTERSLTPLKKAGRRSSKVQEARDMAYTRALDGRLSYQEMADWLLKEEEVQKDEIIARKDFAHHTLAFQTIQSAIGKMLPGFTNLRTQRAPFHLLVDRQVGDVFQTLIVDHQLSDGYRIVLALVLDLVSRMLKANAILPGATPESILGTHGIVLIDEIDLHLHPSWQQRILPDLMRTFPNVQFVVTTHSPQVVSSVPEESIRIIDEQGRIAFASKTEGVSSSKILKRVFGTEAYPVDNASRKQLKDYLDAVYAGRWDEAAVRELGDKLRERFAGVDEDFDTACLHVENEEWEKRHASDR